MDKAREPVQRPDAERRRRTNPSWETPKRFGLNRFLWLRLLILSAAPVFYSPARADSLDHRRGRTHRKLPGADGAALRSRMANYRHHQGRQPAVPPRRWEGLRAGVPDFSEHRSLSPA